MLKVPGKTDKTRYGGLDPTKVKTWKMEWKTEMKEKSAGCCCLQKSARESVRTSDKASLRAPLDCVSGCAAQTPETPFAFSVEAQTPEVGVGLLLKA